jgi:two-component system CheB/CheR fusion protein
MTDSSRANQGGSGFGQRPSELLCIYVSDPQSPRSDEVQRLVAELDFRQRELEAQNQKLQAARPQSEIRESEPFYRTLIETLPVTVVLASPQGAVTYISPAAKEMFGVSPGEGLGTAPTDWIAPEHHEIVRQRMHAVMVELRPQPPVEYKMLKRDRTPIWAQVASAPVLDSEGRLAGVVTVCQDITARKQAEEALRASQERLRLALESAELGWWSWDFATGAIEGDTKTKSLLGSRDITLPLEGILAHTHPDDRSWLLERTIELQRRAGNYEVEFRVVWSDGSIRWVSARGRSFAAGEDKPVRAVGIAMDITDRKRAEEELAAAKASAEQANRVKDDFLAVLSHELRTPLTPTVMALSLLQDRRDLDSGIRETLDMVRRNIEMEALLIDDLLDMTRIARGKIELTRRPVEVCTVIDRAVAVCKPDIEARRLQFGVDMGPAGPYWVEADVPRLQQVFWNLLNNAIKFTPPGGRVDIRCHRANEHVIIDVNDSGIGIEQEALSRIFNPFEQAERSTTRRFGGLGLGLTISKAFVEMHGGAIEAHSEGLGKGATFRIRLPLTAPAGQSEAAAPTAPHRRPVRPLHILLVEDHVVTAQIVRMVLTADGHTVKTAGDVAAALDLADKGHFDLLISDLGLPDGSGHDLMRELRARGHTFSGIALSGYGQDQDIRQSYEAGFAAHLTKPASREAVVEAIAAVAAAKRATSTVDSATTAHLDSPVFDARGALKRCLGKEALLAQMIQFFLTDIDRLLPQIHSALQRGDLTEAGSLAHRLKGTIAHLAAEPAREAARRVEQIGLFGGQQAEAEEAVKMLECECQVLKAALAEYQAAPAPTQHDKPLFPRPTSFPGSPRLS